MTVLAYPETRYAAPELVDITSREECARLGPSALKAFFNIVKLWQLRDEDAMRLLGGMASSTYYAMKKSPRRALDPDTMLRISYLVGIFKALNILHGKALADRWVTLPNRNPIFRGSAPLEYMIRGGIPAIQLVRRLLDARRGGL
ncbi:MAG TPA: MbcA/ParS/Xre antitoxin family protein [Candidatus Nitrosotalea sp.]|nr:MbcA/ParS/Xre antitoxin family protein [Candidatus Nitrosotalea sp.]